MGRGEEERRGGDGRDGVGRVIYPTPIEVVDVGGTLCNVFDAEGLECGGIRVDGLIREREEVTRARRGDSTDTGSSQDIEDDSGAESDLPPGGNNVH